jgi:hypothetical protein
MIKSGGGSFPDRHWEQELGIIFSLRDGFVWASWPDSEASVRLGRHNMVASMMRDFLAQDAIGVRLSERLPNSHR